MKVCTYCGESPPTEKLITTGMYAGGHLRTLPFDLAMERGYPEDPCGPVEECPVPPLTRCACGHILRYHAKHEPGWCTRTGCECPAWRTQKTDQAAGRAT